MRFGMVIDLQRCVGCGACAFACKAENNTRDARQQPELQLGRLPHEDRGHVPEHDALGDAGAVQPLQQRGLRGSLPGHAEGDVQDARRHHDARRRDCIGCRACQGACPYSSAELEDTSLSGETYSVISFNSR